ncbi:MAG: peptidylprolyl isomerase [Acidobacteria bacterium]|nr:peptidylprolyl isomerase [Acidobacteriota bacterium]
MMNRLSVVLALTAAAAFAQTTPAPQKKAATPPAAQKAAPAPATPAREPGLYATFHTSMGTIVAILYEKEAPVTVQNFMALARGGKAWKDPKTGAMVARPLYNGVTFHRVIKNFMIQTGDPTGTGAHDCGFTIKDEVVPTLKFDRPGRLGMANLGSPHTGACQFFITQVPYPSLDPPNGLYTIFGQVVEGQDVVDKIANVPTGANNKPVTPVRIVSVTVKREGPAPAPAVRKTAPAVKKAAPAVKQAAPAAPKK